MAENDKITGKLFVESSFIFYVRNYTVLRNCLTVGEAIESPSFFVEGCPFKILFYPHGRNEAVHSSGDVSLYMRNESSKEVDAVYSLHILQQFYPNSYCRKKDLGFFYDDRRGFFYDDRRGFREVLTLEPHYQTGILCFVKRVTIEDPNNHYLVGDCINIRVTVGVFIDHTFSHPIDSDSRYIFFQLESETEKQRRYFAEESVVLSQCPRLLPLIYGYDRDIIISDIKCDVFEAVLWFIYKNELHVCDIVKISKSNLSEPDSYASRILAAADCFDMKHFKRQCESIIPGKKQYETEEHGLFYKIKSNLEKLFGGADRLLDSSNNKKNV